MKTPPALKTLIAASAASLLTLPAFSALIIDIKEIGSDVVLTSSGSIDTGGLTFVTDTAGVGFIEPEDSEALAGFGTTSVALFAGTITGPSDFGSGGLTRPDSGSGSVFGLAPTEQIIVVPSSYVSGSFLSGTSTYTNTDLDSLGINEGMYTWTWGSGANADSATLTAVPEPSSFVVALTGIAALLFQCVFRRRS